MFFKFNILFIVCGVVISFDGFLVVFVMVCDCCSSSSILNPPDYSLEERWSKLLIASEVVDGTFKYFKIEAESKNEGRPPWDLKNMIKLMYLSSVDKIESTNAMSDKSKSDRIYYALCGGITPSGRSIRDYRGIYKVIFQLILSFTLIITREMGISDFNHLCADGTIKLACNSPFNILKRKDLHLLLKHYMVEELSKKEVKKLRKTAKEFLYDKSIKDDRKVEMIFEWMDKLDLTGQTSISLYDTDARLMRTKDKGQKYKKWAYNIQVCTDTQSKLICGINAVQYPTDDYQIPALLDQTIKNLQSIPSILSADTKYGTLANLFYLKEHGISARIPTAKQNRESNGKSKDKPYSIDHFFYDEDRDVFICPEKQILTLDGVYDARHQKGGFRKKQMVYSNHAACQKCPCKSKCTKAKHRTITRYVHELSLEVERIMSTPEGKKEYALRSRTVESHNGTFKNVFNYDKSCIIGLKRVQGLMFMIASAYNAIRIYNITKDLGMDLYEVCDCIRLIASSEGGGAIVLN